MHSYSVIPLQEAHWPALKTLRLASLLDSPKAFGMSYASAAAFTEAQWRERASGSRGARFFFGLNGEEAVGLIGLTSVAEGDCELIAMWVRPAQRGCGLAAALVDTVKQAALAVGAHTLHLAVSPENLPAARFYQKQGFNFLPHFEPLESDPSVVLQEMVWQAPNQ